MRDLLTALAVLLLLALTGALVAPHLIDWESRREAISAQLTEVFGRKVEVRGRMALQLLPSPYVRLTDLVIGDESDEISAEITRLRLRAALPPLLRGELRFIDAAVQGLSLHLRPEARRPASPEAGLGLPAERIVLERLTIASGRLFLSTGGVSRQLAEGIGGTIETTSLAGPFRGTLSFRADETPRRLRFSAGRIEAGGVRARALVENETALMRYEFEGMIRFGSGEEAQAVSLDGQLAASGHMTIAGPLGPTPVAWRAGARLLADGRHAELRDLDLSLGEEANQVRLAGEADLRYQGPPSLRASLRAGRLDLDRLLAGGEQRGGALSPLALWRLVAPLAAQDTRLSLEGEIDLAADAIILNRGVIGRPRATVAFAAGQGVLRALEATLPGESAISLADGQGRGAAFDGRLEFRSAELSRFVSWATEGMFRSVPVRQAVITAGVAIDPRGIILREGRADLDATRLTAAGQFRAPEAGRRGALTLDLRAEPFEIGTLPAFVEMDLGFDVDIRFTASRVTLAGAGAGEVEARVLHAGETVTVETFHVRDLLGATLSGRGTLSPAWAQFDADLSASRLEAMAEVLVRLFPGAWSEALAVRAPLLVPAALRLSARTERDALGPLHSVTAKGTLAKTAIEASARLGPDGQPRPGAGVTMRVRAPSSVALLRQLGLESRKGPHDRPGELELALGGPAPETLFDLAVAGRVADAAVALRGARPRAEGARFAGQASLVTADLALLTQSLGLGAPVVPPGTAADLAATVSAGNFRVALAGLSGQVAGSSVSGDLESNLLEGGRVTGTLAAQRMALAPLLAIVGVDGEAQLAPANRQRPWSEGLAPWLPVAITLRAGAVVLPGGFAVEQWVSQLRLSRGVVQIEDGAGLALGAPLGGRIELRTGQGSLGLSAALGWHGVEAARLSNGRISGSLGLRLDISGLGATPDALLRSLAGVGMADLQDVRLEALAPDALTQLLRRPLPEAGQLRREWLTAGFAEALAAAPVTFTSRDVPLTLSGGVLRLAPLAFGIESQTADLTVALDLRQDRVDARALYRSRTPPRDWTGAAPEATVLWSGPIAAPERRFDVQPLLNGLTAVALVRDLERIETVEQDARERQFFLRRQRADAQALRRAQELEQFLREEERRRAEAQVRAELEARREAERRALLERQERSREGLEPEPIPRPSAAPAPPLNLRPPAAP